MGKYLHEVLLEATPDDIAYYIASVNLEVKEQQRANQSAKASQIMRNVTHRR